MKAIIYCRVSTKDQAEQGFSLVAQENDCKKFAYDNGYDVDKVFIERGESAKTTDRTQLQKLIKYAVKNKKYLSALIIWKYDRLARNLADQIELMKSFNSLGIRVLSVTENNEDSSVGQLMRNIIGSFAQYENDVKAERTVNGMKQAVEQGRWCWRAPIGYRMSRDAENKPLLVPSEDSRFIVEIFELFASGLYRQTEIVDILKKKGFKNLSKPLINKILRNPLYAGLIKVSWFPDYIKGLHKPLIFQEQFFKAYAILHGKKPSVTPKNRNNPDFPLRNFVRCPKCDQKLTAGWSTGRSGVKYPYYHCRTKGCSLNIRKENLERIFLDYLTCFQPNEEVITLFEEIVLDVWKTKQSEMIKTENRIERELKDLKERKDRIDDLVINGVFDEVTYRENSDELRDEMLAKQVELDDARVHFVDFEECLKYCKYVLSNLGKFWENADLDLRQRFQTLIFPEKLYYDSKTFRTTKIPYIIKHLQDKSPEELHLVSPELFSWNQILQDMKNIFELGQFMSIEA